MKPKSFRFPARHNLPNKFKFANCLNHTMVFLVFLPSPVTAERVPHCHLLRIISPLSAIPSPADTALMLPAQRMPFPLQRNTLQKVMLLRPQSCCTQMHTFSLTVGLAFTVVFQRNPAKMKLTCCHWSMKLPDSIIISRKTGNPQSCFRLHRRKR